jgi:hypothetical protein
METNFKNKVTKSAFLNWYFSDADDINTIGNRVIKGLKADGTITLSVDELFNEAGYIPQHICEVDGAEKDYLSEDEYHPSEVELIDDIANKKSNQETIVDLYNAMDWISAVTSNSKEEHIVEMIASIQKAIDIIDNAHTFDN